MDHARNLGIVIFAFVASNLIAYHAGKFATVDKALLVEQRAANTKLQSTLQQINKNRDRLAALDKYEQIKSELTTLEETLTQKRTELKSLTGKIRTAKRAPVNLPAGMFTVGVDIRPGRYTVVGSSNFFVYDTTGWSKVNVILTDEPGGYGVDQYVCDLYEGDRIKANSRIRLYPWASDED